MLNRTRFCSAMIALSLVAPLCWAQTYTIATVVGGGSTVPSQQPVPAAQARLVTPIGVAVNTAGNLFIADTTQLTELTGSNLVALTGTGDSPWGVAVDSSGNIYIAESGLNIIRRISPGGGISTFAGNGTAGYSGDGGPATSAELQNPFAVAVDAAGNVYIADSANSVVRKVSNGVITTFAGGGAGVLTGSAPATSVFLTETDGLAFDSKGNLYITSRDGFYVYKVTPDGTISIFAGNGNLSNSGDGGLAINAGIYDTTGVAVDAAGNVVIASESGCVIREVAPSGIINTIAGNGTCGYSGDGGPATSAQIGDPWGLAASGTQIYVADRFNHVVRLLTTGANMGGPPTINTGGVVPIFSSSTSIESGSWISIFGTNFASTNTVWNGNFPTSLGNVTVTIDGIPAYIWFVGTSQINVQVPTDANMGPVNVVVTNASGSATATATLSTVAPTFSLFDATHPAGVLLTPNGSGAYGGGAYDLLGPTGAFSFSTRPANKGETVELFGTGFGPTNPVVTPGQIFSGAALGTYPVTVTIGGIAQTVNAYEVGAGLYQVNVTIPSNVASGDVALQASVDGAQTPATVRISVQ
jgi:uncharacterized protein (TIGR03437 family)